MKKIYSIKHLLFLDVHYMSNTLTTCEALRTVCVCVNITLCIYNVIISR